MKGNSLITNETKHNIAIGGFLFGVFLFMTGTLMELMDDEQVQGNDVEIYN